MTSSAPQLYPPQQMQQPQYQPPPPFPTPYTPQNAALYANSLISAYGQIQPPPVPAPPQPYAYDQPTVGAKRSSDDVLQGVDLLSKRPRPDSGATIAFYPQRPGEKLCAFYMTTRTCSFGLTCKFDHPAWVPYGGIPNWKEVTSSTSAPPPTDPASLPQRAGEQNCAFYMKTGDCKYGMRCKFNHPKDRHTPSSDLTLVKDEVAPAVQNGTMTRLDGVTTTALLTSTTGAITTTAPVKVLSSSEKGPGKVATLNSKGLPLRQTEAECTYYVKTGSCKFGATCRFHHPEVVRPTPVARPAIPVTPAHTLAVNMVPAISFVPSEYGAMTSHPQRPGGADCTYYLKTGECSFGASCKFHHPPNRQPSTPKVAPKLTLAGLPRREGETVCAYYMKTGACKYGSTCRFDHPPPGEVAAKAAAEATRTEAPAALEAYDVHSSQGVVPMQYVDLNLLPITTISSALKEVPTTLNPNAKQEPDTVTMSSAVSPEVQQKVKPVSCAIASSDENEQPMSTINTPVSVSVELKPTAVNNTTETSESMI